MQNNNLKPRILRIFNGSYQQHFDNRNLLQWNSKLQTKGFLIQRTTRKASLGMKRLRIATKKRHEEKRSRTNLLGNDKEWVDPFAEMNMRETKNLTKIKGDKQPN